MNWSAWLKGLGVSVVGAATASAASVVNHRLQNGKDAPPITGASVGLAAAGGAVAAFLGYLVQSPMQQLTPPAAAAPTPASPAQS